MAVVVKWLTQRIVAPSCARSNRVSRPMLKCSVILQYDFFLYIFLKDIEKIDRLIVMKSDPFTAGQDSLRFNLSMLN